MNSNFPAESRYPTPRDQREAVAFDALRFPSTSAFLADLPNGLDAHPQCLVKGTLVREFLAMPSIGDLREAVPPVLRAYWEHPPIASSWVPEVHMQVLLQASFDRFFRGRPGGEGAFLQWIRESNRNLFKSPLYRILFLGISAEGFFNRSDRRWSTFRAGSTLEKIVVEPRRALLKIHHPRGLYSDLLTKVRAVAFRAAAECAGARHLEAIVENRTSVQFDISIQWQ